VGWSIFPYQKLYITPTFKEGTMRTLFLIQSGIILFLIYVQMYVQEGTYEVQVAFKAIGNFIVLLSLTFAIALIVTCVRKVVNRNIKFRDGVIRLSIFILPVYYVVQLIGWMYDQGIIGK
jgi:hypothetical protein